MATLHRDALSRLLDSWLQPGAFTDAAENGLQVEGQDEVGKIACGVTANLELIERAIAQGAQAIVVHHGLVWGGGIRRLDGWLGARVRRLMGSGVSLFAYHLPLDAQPEFGNNAGLARALDVQETRPFGRYKGQLIGLAGTLAAPLSPAQFLARVAERVGPVHAASRVHGVVDVVRTVGVCTGGAADLIHDAIAERLDAYVTGEPAEWSTAVASEARIGFVAAGHHATERFGPRGLADKLRAAGHDAFFIDVENAA